MPEPEPCCGDLSQPALRPTEDPHRVWEPLTPLSSLLFSSSFRIWTCSSSTTGGGVGNTTLSPQQGLALRAPRDRAGDQVWMGLHRHGSPSPAWAWSLPSAPKDTRAHTLRSPAPDLRCASSAFGSPARRHAAAAAAPQSRPSPPYCLCPGQGQGGKAAGLIQD